MILTSGRGPRALRALRRLRRGTHETKRPRLSRPGWAGRVPVDAGNLRPLLTKDTPLGERRPAGRARGNPARRKLTTDAALQEALPRPGDGQSGAGGNRRAAPPRVALQYKRGAAGGSSRNRRAAPRWVCTQRCVALQTAVQSEANLLRTAPPPCASPGPPARLTTGLRPSPPLPPPPGTHGTAWQGNPPGRPG